MKRTMYTYSKVNGSRSGYQCDCGHTWEAGMWDVDLASCPSCGSAFDTDAYNKADEEWAAVNGRQPVEID